MFNNRGSTLIEALLAFEIMISVLLIFISLFTSINKQNLHTKEAYIQLNTKEEAIFYTNDFSEIIEMVLR